MLTVYRRHRRNCRNAHDRYARRDKCCCWVEGTIEGKYVRQSLRTRSWERAEELKRERGADLKEQKQQPVPIPTIRKAIEKFLADAEHGRRLVTRRVTTPGKVRCDAPSQSQ